MTTHDNGRVTVTCTVTFAAGRTLDIHVPADTDLEQIAAIYGTEVSTTTPGPDGWHVRYLSYVEAEVLVVALMPHREE